MVNQAVFVVVVVAKTVLDSVIVHTNVAEEKKVYSHRTHLVVGEFTGELVVIIVVCGWEDDVVVAALEQADWALIASSIRVTAAVRAYKPPWTLTAEFAVTDAWAMTFPINCVPVPSVAELPTFQYTLQAFAPLISTMEEAVAVVRVEPILNTNKLFAEPWPSSVSTPVIPAEEAKL